MSPPDATIAALSLAGIGGLVRAEMNVDINALAFLGFLFVLPLAFLAALVDETMRLQLGRLAHQAERVLVKGDDRWLYGYFAAGIALGFMTQFLLLCPTILGGALLMETLIARLPDKVLRAFSLAFYLVPLIGISEFLAGLEGKEYLILFFLGLLGGIGSFLFIQAWG